VTMMTLSLTSVIKQGEFILTRDDDTVFNIWLEIKCCINCKHTMWRKYFLGNKNKHSKPLYQRIDTFKFYIHVYLFL
jgi:hypothetical protein